MMNYFYHAVQLLACILDAGFLYILLKTSLPRRRFRRRLNRVVSVTVISASILVMYYVNRTGNATAYMIAGPLCSILLSMMFFKEKYKRLMLYTLISYVIGISVEILFSSILVFAGMSQGLYLMTDQTQGYLGVLFILSERGLKFITYYFIMKIFSDKAYIHKHSDSSLYVERRFYLRHYMLFYLIPVISCLLLAGISALWNVYAIESSIVTDSTASGFIAGHSVLSAVLQASAAMCIVIVNSSLMYFYEELAIMMAKVNKMELSKTAQHLEEKYYKDLEKMHEQYDVFIHDMKHSMRTIAALSEEGNCEEIRHIIEDMRMTVGSIDDQYICSHKILNSLLSERKGYAHDNGTVFELDISEPLYLQAIDNLDLITLMGNLLDNAIEAEIHSARQEGIICSMHMSRNGMHVIIQVENSFEEKRRKVSSGKHGIGLKSVNEIVRKYGGIFENSKSEGRYSVKVILPVQDKWKEELSYQEEIPAYAHSIFE